MSIFALSLSLSLSLALSLSLSFSLSLSSFSLSLSLYIYIYIFIYIYIYNAKIYYGKCQCGENYIGEAITNIGSRWSEHNNPTHKSELAQHTKKDIEHLFDWSILWNTPSNIQIRNKFEALFIVTMKPTLNEQSKFDHLTLLRKGITFWFINLIDTIPNSIYCI